MEALLLPLGAEWLAVPLEQVREVIVAPAATPVPRSPSWLAGVANLRGELLPILDTAARLGLAHPGHASHVAVVEHGDRSAGVLATARPERVVLGEPAGAGDGPASLGRYVVDGRVATLIDVGRLLGAD